MMYQTGTYRAPHNMTASMSPNKGANMTDTTNPPAGWYPNQYGQMQWWDGHQWGGINPVPTTQMKSTTVAYLLLIFLGSFGAHRFYLKDPATAVLMLLAWWGGWALTFTGIGFFIIGGVVIWWIIDLFLIPGMTRRANGLTLPN